MHITLISVESTKNILSILLMRAENSLGEQMHITVWNFANMKAIELKGTECTGRLNICVQWKCIAWQMFITVSVKIVIIKAKYLYTHTPNPAPLPPNVAYSLDHILHDCQMRKAKSPV